MTKVNMIMTCETIQEAIKQEDWQTALGYANNLAAALLGHYNSSVLDKTRGKK